MSFSSRKVPQVVCLANSLDQSVKGRYYVGQTPVLHVCRDLAILGGLKNPRDSGADLYVNVFTLTNFSGHPLIARVWLDSKPAGGTSVSRNVSRTNLTMRPSRKSPVDLIYHQGKKQPVCGGINVFDRVVPAGSTVVAEEDGKYIVPPGKYFLITLHSSDQRKRLQLPAALAFGWWIKRRMDG